jgi:hypothetical protein
VFLPLIIRAHQKIDIHKFIVWIALMITAVITSIPTAFARLDFSPNQEMPSRYAAYSLLFIIGLTGFILTIIDNVDLNRKTKALTLLTLFVISGVLLRCSYVDGLAGMRMYAVTNQSIHQCTLAPNPTDACLATSDRFVDIVKPRLAYAKEHHLAGY